MTSDLPVSEASPQLQQLIAQVVQSHKPVLIRGEHSNAILLAEEDWSAIQETLYLLSVERNARIYQDRFSNSYSGMR
jgi:antitoxin YefM